MRDLIAAGVALALVFAVLSLATTLHDSRRSRRRKHDAERARGRHVVAELPTGDDLTLFSEDDTCFYYGTQVVKKASILATRVLINGSPIAAATSTRARQQALQPTSFEDRPDGIARDRWDVALETEGGTVLVECGSIRERISQELARAIFDVVKTSVENEDATTPSRESSRVD